VKTARLPEGWLTVVTLVIVLVCAVASVVEAKWVDHISILYTLVVAGTAAGLVASRVRVPVWILHLAGSVVGFGAVVSTVASTLNRGDGLTEKIGVLGLRVITWARVVREGGFGTEPVLFLLLLAVGGWTVGYISAWWVFRRHSAVVPLAASGAVLVVNISYASETLSYVLPYAVAALLLVTRLNYYRQEQTWIREGLRFDRGIWRATLPIGVAVGIVAAAFGWYAPEIPPRDDVNQVTYEVQRPVKDFQWQFNRLFGGIRGRGGIVWAASVSGFGNAMNLSGQFRLADYEVLRVWSPQARYWRAVVYDRYNGQGWTMNQPISSTRLAPGDARLAPTKYEDRIEVTQIVEVVQSRGDYLVGSSEPIRVDTAVVAESLVRPQRQVADEPNPIGEPLALRAPMIPGKTYQVTSSVSVADSNSLRQAGTDYPADIRSRYTRLPAIPQRVRDLAASLTADASNPYDKARAIEAYLRTLPYSLDIPPPPPDRDGVDYFLFDVKAGYCDYYASAMAVMARSVGIPARVVTGYATGSRDSVEEPFIVRDSNAHSWVEVYFPKYGWIEFEPSSYRPAIEHVGLAQFDSLSGIEFSDTPVDSEYLPFDPAMDYFYESPFGGIFEPNDGTGPLRIAGLIALLVALVSTVAYTIWHLTLRGLAPVPATYARVVTLASLLRDRPRAAETPLDYAGRLSQRSPTLHRHLARVAQAYTTYRWGRDHDGRADPLVLETAWREIRRGLISAVPERLRRRLRS